MSTIEELENRIRELETELSAREKDLARYNQELVSANQQLEKLMVMVANELKTASLIQKALVPTEFPNIPGFEFSTKFINGTRSGGDYFDIFEHEDKLRYGIVLAGSSGHAMSALFLSVLLKLTGQIEARRGIAPDRIMNMIAHEIVPNITGPEQASVFYGLVDRRSFDFTYCGVGRVVALLFGYSTGKLTRLENQFPPLAKDLSCEFTSTVESLNPRDRLIFCTEGVVDAKNSEGERFGEERLYKTILRAPKSGAHELRNEILYQLQQFVGSSSYERDITVVVTEVKDRVIKLAKLSK